MGKNKKAFKSRTPQHQKPKPKGAPTPKSAPTKIQQRNDSLSDDSDSFSEDFEALLKGPKELSTKKNTGNEKIPKLVPISENGNNKIAKKMPEKQQKTPQKADAKNKNLNLSANKSHEKQTPGNKIPGNQTPGNKIPANQAAGKQTPGSKGQTPKDKVMVNQAPVKQTPGKQTPGKQTPGKQMPGKQTPISKAELKQGAQKAQGGKVATPVEKKKIGASPKVETPKDKSTVKKRQRDESSDDDDEDEPEVKIAKTSGSPEKKFSQKTASPTKTTKADSPVKAQSAAGANNIQANSKTPIGSKSKKRGREENDDGVEEAKTKVKEVAKVEDDKSTKKRKVAGTADAAKPNLSANTSGDAAKDLQFKVIVDKSKLFIKNFETSVTEKEIKALSPDILEVQSRKIYTKKNDKRGYAYLVFKDEKTADANFKLLAGKKLGGDTIIVDYVGEKSRNTKTTFAPKERELDFLRLYIRGFGDKTESDLKMIFSTAEKVEIPVKKDNTRLGYAFVIYKTEADCKAAHDQIQGKVVAGTLLQVFYANKSSRKKSVPTILQSSTTKNGSATVAKVANSVDTKKTKTKQDDEKKEIVNKKKAKNIDEDQNEDDDDEEDESADEDDNEEEDDDDDDEDEGDDEDSDEDDEDSNSDDEDSDDDEDDDDEDDDDDDDDSDD